MNSQPQGYEGILCITHAVISKGRHPSLCPFFLRFMFVNYIFSFLGCDSILVPSCGLYTGCIIFGRCKNICVGPNGHPSGGNRPFSLQMCTKANSYSKVVIWTSLCADQAIHSPCQSCHTCVRNDGQPHSASLSEPVQFSNLQQHQTTGQSMSFRALCDESI